MKWLFDIALLIATTFFAVVLMGVGVKVWYLVFMIGWNLI